MSPSANGFRKCAQPRNAPSSSWRFPQFGTGDVVVLCVDCGGHNRSGCVEGRKVTVHFLQEICTKTPACHAGSGGRPHTYAQRCGPLKKSAMYFSSDHFPGKRYITHSSSCGSMVDGQDHALPPNQAGRLFCSKNHSI